MGAGEGPVRVGGREDNASKGLRKELQSALVVTACHAAGGYKLCSKVYWLLRWVRCCAGRPAHTRDMCMP